MSAHHRKPETAAPRLRARSVLGGAAMTAVFLGAGTGAAMAGEKAPAPTPNPENIAGTVNGLLGQTQQTVDNALGGLGLGSTGDESKNQDKSRDWQHKDWHKGHWGSDHKWHPAGDCSCEHKKPVKKEAQKKHDCPAPEKKEEKKTEAPAAESESSPTTVVQSIADTSDDSQVESASTSPTEESDDTQVESASTSPSIEDTTPVGSADTGDGSSSPGFTPTFAPAAQSSSLGGELGLAGGLAAAGLLGAYGVTVARRRVGAHRG